MISLTEEARKELEAYFEGKEKTPIRVYLAPGGCSGPRLALALDEPGEDDETSEDNGLTLCINKELAEKVGAVTVAATAAAARPAAAAAAVPAVAIKVEAAGQLRKALPYRYAQSEPSGGVPVAQKAIP